MLRWVWNDWKGSRSSGASQPAAGGEHGQKSLRTGGPQEGGGEGKDAQALVTTQVRPWSRFWASEGVPAGGFED